MQIRELFSPADPEMKSDIYNYVLEVYNYLKRYDVQRKECNESINQSMRIKWRTISDLKSTRSLMSLMCWRKTPLNGTEGKNPRKFEASLYPLSWDLDTKNEGCLASNEQSSDESQK